jgi:hypothetical protein
MAFQRINRRGGSVHHITGDCVVTVAVVMRGGRSRGGQGQLILQIRRRDKTIRGGGRKRRIVEALPQQVDLTGREGVHVVENLIT